MKNILIVGYGREGQSVHRYLVKNDTKARISIADNNNITPLFPVENIFTGNEWLSSVSNYQTIVRSPGVSENTPELLSFKAHGGVITSATNIFFTRHHSMVIGVTGTKGKSTTTSLIAHVLSQKFSDVKVVGNIGRPCLDYLDSETKETIFVFELSSHQLSDIRFSPHIAVILPVVPEHLDYYGSFQAYIEAKAKIIAYQTEKDSVIYNKNCESAKDIAEKSKAHKVPYILSGDLEITNTALLGNKENIMAAWTCCKLFHISVDDFKKDLSSFVPLEHRLQPVGEYRGIRFYNDSLATIPEATIHAIESLGPKTETLIAGGYDRGISYDTLQDFLSHSSIKTIILMGQTGKKLAHLFRLGKGNAITIIEASCMEDAVRAAYAHTEKSKICVLSPAATSFDQFKDYKDRGEQFVYWVRRIARE